jgi:hypothetical protein
LRRFVPGLEILVFTRKKKSSLKKTDLRDIFTKASKTVHTCNILVSPDPLFLTAATSSALKIPENTEEGPDNSVLGDGDIQV